MGDVSGLNLISLAGCAALVGLAWLAGWDDGLGGVTGPYFAIETDGDFDVDGVGVLMIDSGEH